MRMVFWVIGTFLIRRRETQIGYLSTLMAWFAFPMIFRLMEYKESCVRIQARIAGMPMKV